MSLSKKVPSPPLSPPSSPSQPPLQGSDVRDLRFVVSGSARIDTKALGKLRSFGADDGFFALVNFMEGTTTPYSLIAEEDTVRSYPLPFPLSAR